MSSDSVLPATKGEGGDTFDVAIVGAGPGGLTAGIYTSRARLSTVIFERNTAGGNMAITERIENYPGFPEAISGFELAEKMKQQATQFGADLREIVNVDSLELEADGSWVLAVDGERIRARAVILAPGVEARKLGIPGEAEFLGRGVSYCATCDGALYRDKTVVVIGGGDAAIEEGLFLTKFAKAVHVIHRRHELRAQKIIQERAFANPRMHFVWDSQAQRIVGDERVAGVDYQNLLDKSKASLPADGVFFYVGQIPNTTFLPGFVELDEHGFILTDDRMMTGQKGLFAIGDARAGRIKQIAWATGEGALAAIECEKYLDTLGCPTTLQTERCDKASPAGDGPSE